MNRNDQEFLVQKIRTQYTEKEHTQIDALKELDAKVKRPTNVFAYIFGGISAIIMGSGMSLAMTNLGEMLGLQGTLGMVIGVIIGIVGIIFVCLAYPVYHCVIKKEREKIAPEVLQLTEELMK